MHRVDEHRKDQFTPGNFWPPTRIDLVELVHLDRREVVELRNTEIERLRE